MFDLSTLKTVKADTGAVMDVLHPQTDEPIKGMTITLLGQDSEVYRKIQKVRQQATINRMAKGKKAVDLDAEKLAEDTIDDLVKLTVAWEGFREGKADLQCNEETVRRIYSDPAYAWLKEQVQAFIGDRANFFLPLKPS